MDIFLSQVKRSRSLGVHTELYLKQLLKTCQTPSTGHSSCSCVLSEYSIVNLTWKHKGSIYNAWKAQRLSSGTDSLWHSFSLPLLLFHVLYMSLGCMLPSVSRRVDVEMCVWLNWYLWCCMKPSYNKAGKGSKPSSWQDLCLLYCNAICNATLYHLLAKHMCLNWLIQWRNYNWCGGGDLLVTHIIAPYGYVVTSDLYRVDTTFKLWTCGQQQAH